MDSKELAKMVDFGASRVLASTGATPSSRLDSLLAARRGTERLSPKHTMPLMTQGFLIR